MIKELAVGYVAYNAVKFIVLLPVYFVCKYYRKMKKENSEGEKMDENGILLNSGECYNARGRRRKLWIGK